MKKLCWVIIGLICFVLICSAVFYWPKHIQKTVVCCDLTGNTVQVELDLKYCRRLFSDPHLKGSVYVDDVEYVDAKVAHSIIKNADYSLSQWIFYKPTTDNLALLDNTVVLDDLDSAGLFDEILVLCSAGDGQEATHGIAYYGPARTVEEAQALMQLYE